MSEKSANPPTIFIGSSSLTSDIANAIAYNLREEGVHIRTWPINFFDLKAYPIDLIRNKAKECDFAIFILRHKDIDLLKQLINGQVLQGHPSLNFIIGLFLGILENERIFYAMSDKAEVPILSDVKEITSVIFNGENSNLNNALTRLCNLVILQINKLGVRHKWQPFKETSELLDLYSRYTIKILNEEGDCIIRRKLRIKAATDKVNYREHSIYSDFSPSTFDEMQLNVWDEDNQELGIERVYDAPNKKEFRVLFRNQLSKADTLTYTYELMWKKMFPFNDENSDFTLNSSTEKIEFDLVIPSSWDLLHINAIEKRRYGASSENRISVLLNDKKVEDNFATYSYKLQGFSIQAMETKLSWIWKKKA